MLQNTRVTAFTVSELLRENQQGGLNCPCSLRIGLKLHIAVHTETISFTFSNTDIDISVARTLKVLILLMTCSKRILTFAIALVLLTSEGVICEAPRLPGGTIK